MKIVPINKWLTHITPMHEVNSRCQIDDLIVSILLEFFEL